MSPRRARAPAAARRQGVIIRTITTKDLALLMIVRDEHRFSEEIDGVLAKVRRDIPHAEPAVGRAIIGVRLGVRREWLGMRLGPGPMLGEYGRRIEVRLKIQGIQQ